MLSLFSFIMHHLAPNAKIAHTDEEKLSIYKFRYAIYVDEMGKNPPDANHKDSIIKDSLDDTAKHFFIKKDNQIIACSRIHMFEDIKNSALYWDNFQLAAVSSVSEEFCIFSKFMIQRKFRRSFASFGIMKAMQKYCLEKNVKAAILQCTPALIPMYERLGFRQYSDSFYAQGVGVEIPMVVFANDREHYKRVRSPLYYCSKSWPRDDDFVKKFVRTFPLSGDAFNDIIQGKIKTWVSIFEKIEKSDDFLFKNLSRKEVMNALQICPVISGKPNELVISEHDYGNEVFVIIEGTFVGHSSESEVPLCMFQPGDLIGEMSIFTNGKRSISIRSSSDFKALVISKNKINMLIEKHPAIAAKLLHNFSKILSNKLKETNCKLNNKQVA